MGPPDRQNEMEVDPPNRTRPETGSRRRKQIVKTIRRRIRALGPMVALALVVSACGGDAGNTTTTAEAATTTAAEATTTAAEAPATTAGATTTAAAGAVEIAPVESITGTFLGKCTTNPVFPQANDGAVEAATELELRAYRTARPGRLRRRHRWNRHRYQRRHSAGRRDHGVEQRRRSSWARPR